MLAIVEDQEDVSVGQITADVGGPPRGVVVVEHPEDGLPRGIADPEPSELHKPDAVGEHLGHRLRDAQRQARLADPAGTDEGDEAVSGKVVDQLGALRLATDEAGHALRQVVTARTRSKEHYDGSPALDDLVGPRPAFVSAPSWASTPRRNTPERVSESSTKIRSLARPLRARPVFGTVPSSLFS